MGGGRVLSRGVCLALAATAAALIAGAASAAGSSAPRSPVATTARTGAPAAPAAVADARRKRARPARRPARRRRATRAGATGQTLAPTGPPAAGAELAVSDGLGFPNTGSIGPDAWNNYVDLFGSDQVYVCQSGAVGSGAASCARNPLAQQMLDAFNALSAARGASGGHGGFGALGECFGFSSTAIMFKNGLPSQAWSAASAFGRQALIRQGGLSALTPDAVSQVGDPDLRTRAQAQYQALRNLIRERQLLQTSWTFQSWWEQWDKAYGNLTAPALFSLLQGQTASGSVASISIYWVDSSGASEGHTMVARGVQGTPQDFRVSVYDPNYPSTPGPLVHVTAGGWWMENDPDDLYPHSDRPVPLVRAGTPTILVLSEQQMTTQQPVAWWMGDRRGQPQPFLGQAERRTPKGRIYLQAADGRVVQVRDPLGRRALAPNGGPNGDRATAIPGALVRVGLESASAIVLPRGVRYTVTLEGGRHGGGTLFIWDRAGLSTVAVAGRGGRRAEITVDGTPSSVSVMAAPGGGASVGVVRRVGGGRFRSAEAAVAPGARGAEAGASRPAGLGVALDGGGAVRLSAPGSGVRPDVRLGAFGRSLYARVVRTHGAVAAGQALDVRPTWGSLDSGRIRATRVGAGGRTKTALSGRVVQLHAIRSVTASISGGPRPTVVWDVSLRRPSAVTVTIDVRRDGCCDARQVVRGRRGSFTLPALPAGAYSVHVDTIAQDRGNPFLVQRTSRVFHVSL